MWFPGIATLVVAYIFSQFFRAMLAVLTDVLGRDLGATADQLANASGLWFLSFALLQIPVGWALDRIGPRRTCSALFAFGAGGGAMVFALAQGPWHLSLAMVLIGIGCAPVLMGSYFIFAHTFPPARFATLAALVVGVGSLGNLASAAPTTWAVEVFGWRSFLFGLAIACLATAVAILALVKDPPRVEAQKGSGGLWGLLTMPALWLIFPLLLVNYAPAAGLRGLWAGPFLQEVYAATPAQVGLATLVMGLAMTLTTFAYGPLDRWFGTRKWVSFGGNALCLAGLSLLMLRLDGGLWQAVALLSLIAGAGMSYPVIVAHGRAFIPPHLMGRGVTLLNLLSIAGVGLGQVITGGLYAAAPSPEAAYQSILGFYAAAMALGLALYAFSRDRTD